MTKSSKPKRILFLSPYPLDSAPSQRLKYEQYYPYFEAAGYSLTTRSFVSRDFWRIIYKEGYYIQKVYFTIAGYLGRVLDLFVLRKYDLIYVHLWVTPIGLPLFEWLVCMLSKRLVYDVDDMVHLNDLRKTNKVMNLIRGRKKPVTLMKRANHVIVCTPSLEEFARKFNDHVTDISSTIDTDWYQPINIYKNDHKLVIGWSGSHSTSRYLHLLDEVFLELAKEVDFTLKVIGDPDFRLEGVDVRAVSWSARDEVTELQKIDIGVYPLPLDEEWVYGKSGLKALQYMALGIPTVATAVGANYRIIEDGVSGILVEGNIGWLETLRELASNPGLRQSLGKAGREKVTERYSIQSNHTKYLNIFDGAL